MGTPVVAESHGMSAHSRSLATALAFLAPWLAGVALLVAFPFAATFYWSFTRYDLLTPPEPVGFDNYRRLAEEILAGEQFGLALRNTLYYAAVSVPLSIVVGVGLAALLAQPLPGRSLLRAMIFLPSLVPTVAAAILWIWLLDPQYGLAHEILARIGLTGNWFKGPTSGFWLPGWWQGEGGFGSKDALVIMAIWGIGNSVVMYLASLQDIPKSLYEAAELDGAGPFARFWHITLPMLTPVIFFNLLLGLIQAVQAFSQVYLVSEGTGAPAGSSLMLSLHLFLAAFGQLEMGYASAMAWSVLLVLLVVAALLFRSSAAWVHYRSSLS